MSSGSPPPVFAGGGLAVCFFAQDADRSGPLFSVIRKDEREGG